MGENSYKWLRRTILLFAIFLMAVGIINGEVGVVLSKATTICLQCIGIG